MTIDELRNLDTSKFAKAAEGWSRVSNRASAARGRVDHEIIAKLGSTQKGTAATAAMGSLDRLSKNYRYIHAECGLIRTALSGLAEELVAPQRKLKQALEDAEGLKFTVRPNGSVEFPKSPGTPAPSLPLPAAPGGMPALMNPDSTPDPNQAKAQDIANRIGEALKEASEIDGRYARALTKLIADGDLNKTDLSDVAQDLKDVRAAAGRHFSDSKIPKGKSPKENADWWSKRTQAERDELVSLYPASIGALNGLPAVVRDEANRVVLAEAHLDIKQKIDELGRHEPTKLVVSRGERPSISTSAEWVEWKDKRDSLKKHLQGIEDIESRLSRSAYVEKPGERPVPEAYLLGFDTKGIGHAVVANGNPDTAAHTAVYVPGTTSRLSNIEGNIKRMEKLWSTSTDMADGQSVSTITWLGYDAPQSLAVNSPETKYANEGGPKLNEFLNGLRTTHHGAPSHLTVDGHSYGSTVIGSAARQGTLPVDDVFVEGSPGMQVGHASKLDVKADHVWAAEADSNPFLKGMPVAIPGLADDKHGGFHVPFITSDPVPELGGWKHAPKKLDVDLLPSWVDGDGMSVISTVTPTDREFGANIVATGKSRGHSGYWDMESESIRNQARIVVGKYDKVTLEDD
ncbi:alpha/beta hydrolase [Streptomyces sp. NPDC053079]|uniref:alpha/beta hydrolase n=1 Tax=Streptomyces sp. NPDC053079 TaxID=3365697 RepID=UPI0037D7449D